jgi:hypothetical protein
MWQIIYLILLVILSFLIIYQDLKRRLVSLWIIIAYAVTCLSYFLYTQTIYQLLENALFALLYFLLCYSILHLYFYVKQKKFIKILDEKIGWADVLIAFAIGCIMPMHHFIFFITLACLLSILCYLVVPSFKKSIPFAAVVCFSYLISSIINTLFVLFTA